MADVKMVNLTIEGRPVRVPDGTSILEAAKYAGVLVPHYCYHPGLPVAGVCRMCLVEVEKAPKLAPSCATQAMEGQVVHVHSDKALEARKGVLEMLLINHPLDCPICDQAGECELQDYTYQEGRAEGRYRDPKRFNPVEDFGGDVIYVANRCILCTRCVRFMDDVAHDPVLSVAERGDRALIGRFEGQDLTHPWAGNVVELCPVGALLSKDSLNKARAWELDRAASVCPNCSQGCNMIVETRDNQVVRLRPRPNQQVNEYFMCDHGRLNYRWMNRQDRVSTPMVRQNGVLASADWEVALRAAAGLLAGARAFVLASPNLSNEALHLLGRLVDRTGGDGAFRVNQGPEAPLPGVEDLALRSDRAANVRGAELAGFTRSEAPLAGMQAGDVLVVADEELDGVDVADVARAGAIVVIGTTLPVWARHGAAVVLPIANMVEEEGTYTNLRGRVQRFLQAKAAPGIARPSFFVVGDLLAAMGEGSGYWTASQAFDAMVAARPAFAGMSYDSLGLKGAMTADAAAGAST
ncbi:MAG: NADH:ubiquinone oxidoreductase, subunit iron-sulfur binding protein [Gemmatimonadetes bacterium]|jgi:NADH-quinone oxidoreductase subunit G|nr:NADH:ubiquinone oxidoreductase, subunit iron-sulfur binding protein [Gemmatimonadota bacterium]